MKPPERGTKNPAHLSSIFRSARFSDAQVAFFLFGIPILMLLGIAITPATLDEKTLLGIGIVWACTTATLLLAELFERARRRLLDD